VRHTCLTRLREAGMALEAVQAQAGHASIESTRIYLHLADDWLASQYRRAAEAIDAQLLPGKPFPIDNPVPLEALGSFVDGDEL
jgi:integrase/recombinase XerD